MKKCKECGNDFTPDRFHQYQEFCCVKCRVKYENKDEEKQRKELTDRIVKRNIYIKSKGAIKYDMMTPEMIKEQRESVLAFRKHKEELSLIRLIPKIKNKNCVECGKIFSNKTKNLFCSNNCRSLNINKKRMFVKTTKIRICKECDNEFISEYGNKQRVFCSKNCLGKYNDKVKSRNARQRARKFGVEYEYVNPLKVFIRDGWRCQLCNKLLNKTDRGKIKNNAPELDHIIPISKGGSHTYMNTQCTCRKCNGNKNNQCKTQQIRLFI